MQTGAFPILTSYCALGRYQEAIKDYDKALELSPDNKDYIKFRDEARERQQRLQGEPETGELSKYFNQKPLLGQNPLAPTNQKLTLPAEEPRVQFYRDPVTGGVGIRFRIF